APDIPLMNMVMSPKIRKDPLGAVLILGCWNYPLQLSFGPVIGAIAAGCTAILKPSEVSSASAMVLKKIVAESLDPQCYAVVNERHLHRIKKMIDSTNGRIIFGGGTDEADNFIELTAVLVDSTEDSLIKEESFGPLLPILPIRNLDEAIRIANDVHSTPLGL